jgi:hypothetical protein
MRRLLFVLGAVMAFVVVASPASAQFKFGVHGDYIAGGFSDIENVAGGDFDLSGDLGLGGRLAFSPPALPIVAYGDLTYFFPSCGDSGSCSYWTAGLGGQIGLPLPAIRPYILGGWQWQSFNLDVDGFESSTNNHPFAGVGVELGMLAGLFVEGQWEFNKDDPEFPDVSVTPFVLKVGFLFGG